MLFNIVVFLAWLMIGLIALGIGFPYENLILGICALIIAAVTFVRSM